MSAKHPVTKPGWQLRTTAGQNILALSGDWIAQSGDIPQFPPDSLEAALPGKAVTFDQASLGRWDTGLIAFLWDVKRAASLSSLSLGVTTLPEPARKLLDLLPEKPAECAPSPHASSGLLRWVGGRTLSGLTEIGTFSTMLSIVAKGVLAALGGKALMRRQDLLADLRNAGPAALEIVSIVNFLTGMILAFVGAVQLRKFAADIYVANLVGLALVREMAAVMTAIVMAGRTGGAYAARIATMQGNEEIDALTVVGIPVSDYIVLPAVLALMLTMPFLYLYGCLVGLLGGFAVSIAMLNITGRGFFYQVAGAVPLDQFAFGLIKTFAFALLIGIASCRIGLKAGRSAAEVGTAATQAVVVGIVGVIAIDAVFAVVADALGI